MPSDTITSLTNPKIKQIVQLRNKRQRGQSGLTIVEGVEECIRFLSYHQHCEEIFICDEYLNKHGKKGLNQGLNRTSMPVTKVSQGAFDKMSFGERKEGIIIVARITGITLDELKLSLKPFIVVVEDIEKPGNLGAMIRTCDGAGIDAILIADKRVNPLSPNVIRASLGTVFSLPVCAAPKEDIVTFLKKNKIKMIASLVDAKKTYIHADLSGSIALFFGSEKNGLSDYLIQASNEKVKIPMHGDADSLNVSATASILIYESLRQRSQN